MIWILATFLTFQIVASDSPPPWTPPLEPREMACAHNFTEDSGIFSTKNFPEEYAEYSDLCWNITVAEGKRIKLTFHLLNVSILSILQWIAMTFVKIDMMHFIPNSV